MKKIPCTLFFQRPDGKMGRINLLTMDSSGHSNLKFETYFIPSDAQLSALQSLKGRGPRWMALGFSDAKSRPVVRKGLPVFPKRRTFLEFGAAVKKTTLAYSADALATVRFDLNLAGPVKMHAPIAD